MTPCSELRHIYQQHGDKWESVIFSGPISNATIYHRSPAQKLDPRPVAEVGAENGWCAISTNNLDLHSSKIASVQSPPPPPPPRPPLPQTSEIIDIGIALLVFAGVAAGVRVLSLHFAPPPLPSSYAEPPAVTENDRPQLPNGDGQRSVTGDREETTEKPPLPSGAEEIDEPFDLTGITLGEFKNDLCDGVANGGQGFEPFDINHPKKQPAIMKAVHDYMDEYGPQKKAFCLWQVFKLTRKSGESPYAQRCEVGLKFIEQQFASYDPTEVF